MTVLIHVLGSDIPHHNRTVLRFFNDALAATSEHAREFMVVGKDDGLSDSCPALSVQFFPGKKSLAEEQTLRRYQCDLISGLLPAEEADSLISAFVSDLERLAALLDSGINDAVYAEVVGHGEVWSARLHFTVFGGHFHVGRFHQVAG